MFNIKMPARIRNIHTDEYKIIMRVEMVDIPSESIYITDDGTRYNEECLTQSWVLIDDREGHQSEY